jgi:hypothetical protein
MSVLPKITYGNMALIFLSRFHRYNKNEIFTDYWDTVVCLNSKFPPPVELCWQNKNISKLWILIITKVGNIIIL